MTDPALAGHVTNDILIDFEGNLRGQQLLLNLTAGSIHQNAGAFGGNVAPLGALLGVDATLAHDTFVTLGGASLPAAGGLFATAGDFVLPGGAVNIPGGTPGGEFSTSKLDFAWAPGTGKNVEMGTDFMTARITLSDDAAGTFMYFGSTAAGTGDPLMMEGSVAGGVISFGGTQVDPPVAVDADLGQRIQGALIEHMFDTSAGTEPITWGNLQVVGPTPANAPTLNSDGSFSWNSHGSPFGTYMFNATASNSAGDDVGALTVELIVPEPATMSLVGLAMLGLVGLVRRRS